MVENTYIQAKTVEEALQAATQHKHNARYLAGGTDVMVNKFQGNLNETCLIDITGISEMHQVEEKNGFLSIGSLITLAQLHSFPAIKQHFPALLQAADFVAAPVIRKTATLGGNLLVDNRCIFYNQSEWWREAVGFCLKCDGDICIATGGKKNCFSKFVSDTAVALIAMQAQLEIASENETLRMPLENLYSGDGVTPHNFNTANLIKSVLLPTGKEFRAVVKKLRQRESLEFSSLTTCVSINNAGEIYMVLGGVDPKPVVVKGDKNSMVDELIKTAVKKARLVDNDVYARNYRKEMISVFLQRSCQELNL